MFILFLCFGFLQGLPQARAGILTSFVFILRFNLHFFLILNIPPFYLQLFSGNVFFLFPLGLSPSVFILKRLCSYFLLSPASSLLSCSDFVLLPQAVTSLTRWCISKGLAIGGDITCPFSLLF